MTARATADIAQFDLRSPPADFYRDPYPYYRALRARGPVCRCADGGWFVSGHVELNQVYRNPRLFSSDKQLQFKPMFGASPLYEHHTTSLVFNDPPLHTHVRKAIGDALSPRVVNGMAAGLERLVGQLLDRLAARGECELMQDFAVVIPLEVIGNLLDLTPAERLPLQRWSNAILGALEFASDPEVLADGNRAVEAFVAFLTELVARRRAQPGEDLVSRLLRWESGEFRLSPAQVHHQCIFLLNAGHETTTNLIGNGVLALLEHPDQLARLRETPALIDRAVEEFLRYEAPVQLGNRTVTAATTLGGQDLAAGDILTLGIGAANRDPAIFAEPDRLDITREPNPHNAFGGGIHTCAGLAVARLEARVAIGRLVARFPRLELAGPVERAPRARFRCLTSLPLRCA